MVTLLQSGEQAGASSKLLGHRIASRDGADEANGRAGQWGQDFFLSTESAGALLYLLREEEIGRG